MSISAGMASTRKTLDLPSGLFLLDVSVATVMARANGGKGIEGLGVTPHVIVAYDPDDLRRGVDTLIRRAEERLRAGTAKLVPYDPARFGWRAP